MTFFLEKLLLDPADCPVPVLDTLSDGRIAVVLGVFPTSPPVVLPGIKWMPEPGPSAGSEVDDPEAEFEVESDRVADVVIVEKVEVVVEVEVVVVVEELEDNKLTLGGGEEAGLDGADEESGTLGWEAAVVSFDPLEPPGEEDDDDPVLPGSVPELGSEPLPPLPLPVDVVPDPPLLGIPPPPEAWPWPPAIPPTGQ